MSGPKVWVSLVASNGIISLAVAVLSVHLLTFHVKLMFRGMTTYNYIMSKVNDTKSVDLSETDPNTGTSAGSTLGQPGSNNTSQTTIIPHSSSQSIATPSTGVSTNVEVSRPRNRRCCATCYTQPQCYNESGDGQQNNYRPNVPHIPANSAVFQKAADGQEPTCTIGDGSTASQQNLSTQEKGGTTDKRSSPLGVLPPIPGKTSAIIPTSILKKKSRLVPDTENSSDPSEKYSQRKMSLVEIPISDFSASRQTDTTSLSVPDLAGAIPTHSQTFSGSTIVRKLDGKFEADKQRSSSRNGEYYIASGKFTLTRMIPGSKPGTGISNEAYVDDEGIKAAAVPEISSKYKRLRESSSSVEGPAPEHESYRDTERLTPDIPDVDTTDKYPSSAVASRQLVTQSLINPLVASIIENSLASEGKASAQVPEIPSDMYKFPPIEGVRPISDPSPMRDNIFVTETSKQGVRPTSHPTQTGIGGVSIWSKNTDTNSMDTVDRRSSDTSVQSTGTKDSQSLLEIPSSKPTSGAQSKLGSFLTGRRPSPTDRPDLKRVSGSSSNSPNGGSRNSSPRVAIPILNTCRRTSVSSIVSGVTANPGSALGFTEVGDHFVGFQEIEPSRPVARQNMAKRVRFADALVDSCV